MDAGEPVCGGCEGPDSMYIKLISSDGHEFIIKKEHAFASKIIQAMLSGSSQFIEYEKNEITFGAIESHVLQKVSMYFTYNAQFNNSKMNNPEFPIDSEIALDILMAADFLDC
ncbi:elongin-C-like [Procambarus clarkii]|uniref:elongin-C-like n=1 Tax=Procambarus clarkii TaxID=6728 RepID=UPI0037443277